jgi:glycosyltransferase involved in cell wall biosynthesis
MKVLVLTRYSRMGASSRMRSLQYIDAWAANEHEFHVQPLLGDAYLRTLYRNESVPFSMLVAAHIDRLRMLLRVRDFDLVWFEKELFPKVPACFERLLSYSGVPYVVDYDDAIFHNYDLSDHPLQRLLKNKIKVVMQKAELVVCGNDYLVQYARRSGARHVEKLPTVVDLRRYPVSESDSGDRPLVVGWIGTPATAKFLHGLLPAMERLAEKFPLEFAVVGPQLDTAERRFMTCTAWSEDNEVEQLSRFDIGVMPLPDEPWEQGKCGYKLIQYMACGKPVVASPVGVNKRLVENGRNGFLAASEPEWILALTSLLSDPGLRRSMGRNGRALVEREYCLQVTAPVLLEWMERIVYEHRINPCAE